MATGSGAFGAKCGFNQSGGGLFIVLTGGILVNQTFEAAVASGSGGSFLQAAPVANATLTATVGTVLKDMGKTINFPTSTGRMRTFRKFQVVGNASGDAANFGVNASTGRPFYLETMREGGEPDGGVAPPLIARYF